jgi:serine/threonine-protein kinase
MTGNNRVAVDPLDPQEEGQRLQVGRRIGAGGMGVVNEARDRRLRRRMAIKVLRREAHERPMSRRRFIEEAQITSQLDHPNIIPVHEFGRDREGCLYFTMKLVAGDTLTERLAAMPPAMRTAEDLYDLLQVFLKVCDAVAFAHSRGVIHRDLKPDNVMVGAFGEVYVMDWGLAKATGRAEVDDEAPSLAPNEDRLQTAEGIAVGTPAYMSPEQASGQAGLADERSDVFALGAILYQILTHEPPYPEMPIAELLKAAEQCQIMPPQRRASSPLPPRLCTIAMKALSKDPNERHQSALELGQEVERFLQSGWQFPMRRFAPGALVVREGTMGDTAYAIVAGTCRAFQETDRGRRQLRTMGRGDVFGETAVFSKQRRSATVEAVDEVTVIEITRQQFEEDLGMGFWMGLFVRALASRFQEKEQRIIELEAALAEARRTES